LAHQLGNGNRRPSYYSGLDGRHSLSLREREVGDMLQEGCSSALGLIGGSSAKDSQTMLARVYPPCCLSQNF